ncbi:MAG: hypothetical protein HQ541_06045 [Mariniphaga sp.]|nr:hypothetical protein [Mariniphaga sp.]
MLNKIKRYLISTYVKLNNSTCTFSEGARVSRKACFGKNIKFGENCRIGADVIIGDGVSIGVNTTLRHIRIGINSHIESGIKIVGTGKGKIKIGKECYIGANNILDNSDDIIIGDFVHIAGPSTGLWCHSTAQMCMNSIPLNDSARDKYRPTSPIRIESNVYVGGNCTIYPGITIGHHSVIAPNSAVTKDVPSSSMVGGVPAKVINGIKKTS